MFKKQGKYARVKTSLFGGYKMELAFGIVLLVMAVFLIVAVLMQSGKDKNLSGTIAGGAETFFGKSKASTMDKVLSRVTMAVAIIFTIIVVVMYVIVA